MRLLAQFVGMLLLVGFVGAYWWLVALVIAAVLAVKFGPRLWRASPWSPVTLHRLASFRRLSTSSVMLVAVGCRSRRL